MKHELALSPFEDNVTTVIRLIDAGNLSDELYWQAGLLASMQLGRDIDLRPTTSASCAQTP